MTIKCVKIRPNAILPKYATVGSAAQDVYACTALHGEVIAPGDTKEFPTGWVLEIPEGWCMKLYIRSGMGARGLVLSNGVGVIDCDYRGEVIVSLKNTSQTGYRINHGDRIAQIMPERAEPIVWQKEDAVSALYVTKRGKKAFGGTGR